MKKTISIALFPALALISLQSIVKISYADQTQFQIVREYSEGLAAVNNGEKRYPNLGIIESPGVWGYIDQAGKLVLPMKFTHAESFHEGLAAVELDHHTGFIDHQGKMQFEAPFDVTMGFHEGSPKRFGYIDKTGTMVIPPQFESAGPFHSGWAPVSDCEKRGRVDRNGKTVWSQP